MLCNELSDSDTGIPFQGPARSAAVKLLSGLPGRLRELVGEFSENIDLRMHAHHPHTDVNPVYSLLTESLGRRRQVRIRYGSLMPNEPSEFSTLLSPYRLLFKRRAWYVIGRSSIHRAVRTFHLGRIHHIEAVESQYRIPERFTLDRYFGNAWNMIRDRKQRHEVVVRFQPMVAHNVGEVHWHKSQRLVWNDDGTMDFHVTVDGLREIQWWIIGYGDQAEVLQPAALRDAMKYRVDAMRAIYSRKTKRKTAAKKSKPSPRKPSARKKPPKKSPRGKKP